MNSPISDVAYSEGSQFLSNYYNGRGSWNEETETLLHPSDGEDPVNVLKTDSKYVKGYYDLKAAFEMPDLPQFDMGVCQAHAAMCCWPRDRQAGDNNGNCNKEYDSDCIDKNPADNTNLCYNELDKAPYSNGIEANGFSVFLGDNNAEGPIHCQ